MKAQIVIGIDGGGTYTRALAADLNGRVLATAEAGAASPYKTDSAEENVRQAIRDALSRAGCDPEQVVGLVAGMAGLDAPEDHVWAERFTALPSLNCPRLHVNDAVVAHAGALESRPGIIAISGTGSIIFGATEDGRQIRNYDFSHYAPTSACHLAFNAVHRILAEDTQPEDAELIQQVLAFWGVEDVGGLRALGTQGFCAEEFERIRRFGAMASLVTEAASSGAPLARSVCDNAAAMLAIGIRLIGSCFAAERVEVALIGGAVRSAYVQQAVAQALSRSPQRGYEVVDPALSCAAGAVLMALDRTGVVIDAATRARLKTTSEELAALAAPILDLPK
jgi:glucosamine kinase